LKNPNSPSIEETPKIDAGHMLMARIVMVHAMNRLFKYHFEETDFEGLPERALFETDEDKTAVIFHFKLLRVTVEAIFSIRIELDENGEPIFEIRPNLDWAKKNLKRVRPEDLTNEKDLKSNLN
jgi:hypothetical protein